MKSCSCIIPIFNEESRISSVLKATTQVKEISEIICIDDGSSDNSTAIVKEEFPQVRLIQHPTNLGKTAAIMSGLEKAKSNTLLLIDSDLIDLKSNEISAAMACFRKYGLDCLLLNTAPMNNFDETIRHVFRFLLLAAGNRVISKKCLEQTLHNGKFKGYHLEIAQNKYLMDTGKNVAYFDISAKDVSKIRKIGWAKGWKSELAMWYQMITYAGLIFFIKQTLFFARKKVN